ncbi:MAG TPA: hypothetical protein GX497_12625 [Bacillus bacterium]|nr:hypothetical protein [Bacillus sp. (in: firmicutes)]
MPTFIEVEEWIQANVLDTTEWDKSHRKEVAIIQAERNLIRWYQDVELTVEHIALQSIWEVEGLNSALKFQKHGVKSVSDGGERVDYGDKIRDAVAPEVRQILGTPLHEKEESEPTVILEGGMLL